MTYQRITWTRLCPGSGDESRRKVSSCSSRVKPTALLEAQGRPSSFPAGILWSLILPRLEGTPAKKDTGSVLDYVVRANVAKYFWDKLILKLVIWNSNFTGCSVFIFCSFICLFCSVSQLYSWLVYLCQECWADHKSREGHYLGLCEFPVDSSMAHLLTHHWWKLAAYQSQHAGFWRRLSECSLLEL